MGIFSTFAEFGYLNIIIVPAFLLVFGIMFLGVYLYIYREGGRGGARWIIGVCVVVGVGCQDY